jgi:hypothetical protein
MALHVGVILACASIHVPIVLDDYGTWAAALVAARMSPPVAGYLFAAHAGGRPATAPRSPPSGSTRSSTSACRTAREPARSWPSRSWTPPPAS